MANGKLTLGKQSGGTLGLVFPDGVSNTEVVLPESGNIVSVDTAVTDNAIARYDGTTGKLQNSSSTIDDTGVLRTLGNIQAGSADGGNSFTYIQKQTVQSVDPVLQSYVAGVITAQIQGDGGILCKSTGGIGYGTGAGGIVTQLTSKSTAVTLNKPSGTILTHNSALAAGATVEFVLFNNLISGNDTITLGVGGGQASIDKYNAWSSFGSNGVIKIFVKNISTSSLSEPVAIRFAVIKGASN